MRKTYKEVEREIMNIFGYTKNLTVENLSPLDKNLVHEIESYVLSTRREMLRNILKFIEQYKFNGNNEYDSDIGDVISVEDLKGFIRLSQDK